MATWGAPFTDQSTTSSTFGSNTPKPLPGGYNPPPVTSGPPGGVLDLLSKYMPDVSQQGLLGMMARNQTLYTPGRGGTKAGTIPGAATTGTKSAAIAPSAITQGNLYLAPNVAAFPNMAPAGWTWNGAQWIPPAAPTPTTPTTPTTPRPPWGGGTGGTGGTPGTWGGTPSRPSVLGPQGEPRAWLK